MTIELLYMMHSQKYEGRLQYMQLMYKKAGPAIQASMILYI